MRDDRKLSESNEAEREKLREGQKLYSSSSINNEKSNDDSSGKELSHNAILGNFLALTKNSKPKYHRCIFNCSIIKLYL